MKTQQNSPAFSNGSGLHFRHMASKNLNFQRGYKSLLHVSIKLHLLISLKACIYSISVYLTFVSFKTQSSVYLKTLFAKWTNDSASI